MLGVVGGRTGQVRVWVGVRSDSSGDGRAQKLHRLNFARIHCATNRMTPTPQRAL